MDHNIELPISSVTELPDGESSSSVDSGPEQFLGSGRSADVYKCVCDGQEVARKIFCGTDLTNLILTLFYGAPVDYKWCEPAIKAAYYRRKALKGLTKFWFGGKLTIANSIATGVNAASHEQYMDTEFVDGQIAPLYNPFSENGLTEFKKLKYRIFPELQKRLLEAGMDGTVWQAGYGQPCAIPNFLLSSRKKWVWIDAESGVPAIVSYNVSKLLFYYIPKAFKFRRVMFDSLDCDKFSNYLKDNENALRESLGDEYGEFAENCKALINSSTQWQGMSRNERSRGYLKFSGRMTDEQDQFYAKHTLLFLIFLVRSFFRYDFPGMFRHLIRKIMKFGAKLNPVKLLTFCVLSLFSGSYRVKIAHNHIESKIDAWLMRKRLTAEQAEILHRELGDNSARKYLSDFGVFILFKPVGYIIRLLVAVMLTEALIDAAVAAFIITFISIILRTVYSLYRCLEDLISRKEISWVALLVSPLPMIGTLAHPCQMLHSARKGHSISQFIIYEVLSTAAAKIPVFGGYGSEIEYQLNRVGFKLVMFSLRRESMSKLKNKMS